MKIMADMRRPAPGDRSPRHAATVARANRSACSALPAEEPENSAVPAIPMLVIQQELQDEVAASREHTPRLSPRQTPPELAGNIPSAVYAAETSSRPPLRRPRPWTLFRGPDRSGHHQSWDSP